jgi:hypothetical protein
LTRVFVDVADEPDHRRFFIEYKKRSTVRFQQFGIGMTTGPFEVP